MKRAFTLIELLVVIAIIAILAAILFPVFAQAKVAAKKAVDISNLKQTVTSTLIYSNDADDLAPHSRENDPWIFQTRLMPYTKNRDIFKSPISSHKEGTLQYKQCGSTSACYYFEPPSDPCIGLGTSKYGTSGAAITNSYYNDIYVPTDYDLNEVLFGYDYGACAAVGSTRDVIHGVNMTSGFSGGDGTVRVGGTKYNLTSPAKAILMITYPMKGSMWPAYTGLSGYWGGLTWPGPFAGGSNASHLDGHAQYYKTKKLIPDDTRMDYHQDDTGPVTCPSCSVNAGRAWRWWGTNLATTDLQ